MPMYKYRCVPCKWDQKKLFSPKQADAYTGACPWCGTPLTRQVGTPSSVAKETADDYRGTSVDQDIGDKVADRAHDHFIQHDLPRIIAEEGMEFAKRQGFVDEDGRPKPRSK